MTYTITPQQFAQEAIKHGFTGSECKGWDWIKDNLHLLDDVFQLPEYKEADGMKYKCMPFFGLLQGIEEQVISTAWYLNNQRVHDAEKLAYKNKMLNDGYIELTEEVFNQAIRQRMKLEVIANKQGAIFTSGIKNILTPMRDGKNFAFLLPPRCTRKGYYLASLENAFCKLV